jgi:hypothetical protein
VSIESLVLDSQGFSSWIDRDRKVMRLLEQAERDGADLAMSAGHACTGGQTHATGRRLLK